VEEGTDTAHLHGQIIASLLRTFLAAAVGKI